jgi:hypothetical protein
MMIQILTHTHTHTHTHTLTNRYLQSDLKKNTKVHTQEPLHRKYMSSTQKTENPPFFKFKNFSKYAAYKREYQPYFSAIYIYIYIYICLAKYFKQLVASLQQELFQKLAF